MSIFDRKIKLKRPEQTVHVNKNESPLSLFLKNNVRLLIFFAGAVLVIFVGFQALTSYRKSKIETLSDKIYFSFKSLNSKISEVNVKELSDLSALIDNNDNSSVIGQTQIAGLFGEARKFNEAHDIYVKIYQNAANPLLKVFAGIGLGYSLEGKGEFDQALTIFNEVINLKPSDEFKYLADTAIARCLEQKSNNAEALKSYKKIIETYPTIADKSFIEFKIKRLST